MGRPRLRIAGTVLHTRDAQRLAAFHEQQLGWPRLADEQHVIQPQDAVRVMVDPDGHPFGLFVG